MPLNFSQATRRPITTFKKLCKEHAACILTHDAVITRRLLARGVTMHACPYNVQPGSIGRLGRIFYAAAIDANDAAAVTALEEERKRRK